MILKITLNGSSLGALGSLADRVGAEFTWNDTHAELSGLDDWTEAIQIASQENPHCICEVL